MTPSPSGSPLCLSLRAKSYLQGGILSKPPASQTNRDLFEKEILIFSLYLCQRGFKFDSEYDREGMPRNKVSLTTYSIQFS